MTTRPTRPERPDRSPRVSVIAAYHRLLCADLAFFMSQLRDPAGTLLTVAPHHRRWCAHVATAKRLVLLAPRDHGKSYLGLVYVLWCFYRHGRDPLTGTPLTTPSGLFGAVMFSATHDQAGVLMATFRDLLAANEWLFGPINPGAPGAASRQFVAWSRTQVRLANGAELRIRAYDTSTRGLHPDLLILDDVLSDQNSLSQRQRNRTWYYLVSTLLPMGASQMLILGTAFHQDDLLHRLAPRPAAGAASGGATAEVAVLGFEWHRYRALDPETETALWESRHPARELKELRDFDPTTFSREYQNVPRDDAASIFPYELTQRALDAGADLTFVPAYNKERGELTVLGADFAVSEAAAADFTVIIVAAVNVITGRRRLLTAERRKGLDLRAQIDLLVELCRRYRVDVGIVEKNAFQSWLLDELRPWPDIRDRIHGHTTGREKNDPIEGVLGLKLKLRANLWVMPCGDDESRRFARVWQAEMSAFGWTDGRLKGLGEHDDTVMATWFVERAIRYALDLLALAPTEEIVTLEDVGITRYRISPDLDAADGPRRINGWDDGEFGGWRAPEAD
jgi:hypothetical protein